MPRTRSRSSSRASAEFRRAWASSRFACAGSCSTSISMVPRSMPMATSRACAPSCRSRSMRRSSAAEVSTASCRVSVSTLTRSASSASPPSTARVSRKCVVSRRGARRQATARTTAPSRAARKAVPWPETGTKAYQYVSPLWCRCARHSPAPSRNPSTGKYSSRAGSSAVRKPAVMSTGSQRTSRQVCGSRSRAKVRVQGAAPSGGGR